LITLNKSAAMQLQLIKDNDFTTQGKVFRLAIDGKECNGFTYALGFTDPDPKDIVVELTCDDFKINLHIDPFVQAYCQNGTIEYLFDPAQDVDSIYFINDEQQNYHGKFFKDPSKIMGIQS
jgi:iron-sulfur cluster insertion protein